MDFSIELCSSLQGYALPKYLLVLSKYQATPELLGWVLIEMYPRGTVFHVISLFLPPFSAVGRSVAPVLALHGITPHWSNRYTTLYTHTHVHAC